MAKTFTGVNRPTENRLDNETVNKRVEYWINLLKDCENTHVGSHEAKSNVLVDMIRSIQKGDDHQEVAEKVVRKVPCSISIKMAYEKARI